jgi:hypothetical protein
MTKVQSLLFLAALSLLTGCVERRFVVETNVPGAQVYVNSAPVGPSPADARWDYAGNYVFRVVAQGYEPLTRVEHVKARWYDYPPLDFFFETLWPFHVEDVRRFRFDLVPATQIRTDELLDAANNMRAQGQSLPEPKYPDVVKSKPPETPSQPVMPATADWQPQRN